MDFRTENGIPAPDWDHFVRNSDHGSHQQSSLWAAVKRTQHWDAFRVIAEDGAGIAGGAQVLHRRAPFFGRIGYIKFGPVVRYADKDTVRALLSETVREARRSGISVLYVQAAPEREEATGVAVDAVGFRPSGMELSLPTTSVIRLDRSDQGILADMRRSTRRNIHQGLRSGLTVRSGGAGDVDTLVDLLALTGRRHGFKPESRAFYHELWHRFHPIEGIHMVLVEKGDEPVAGTLLIAFGKTVRCFRGGWSGQFGKLRPNELAIWAAIRWARDKGYAYFDQDGTRAGEDDSASSFKEGFGGETVLMPPVHEWVRSPLVNAVAFAVPRLGRWDFANSLVKRLGRGSRAHER